MRTRLIPFMLSFTALATAAIIGAQEAPSPQNAQIGPARVVVPAETTIPLVLKNTLNSRTAHQGQAVYCETIFPITVGNRIVIPTGTAVKGSVTQVMRPGRVKGRAQIGVRFETIILTNGTTRPLRATLSGYGGAGEEKFNAKESKIEGASSKGEDVGRIATTAAQGTVIGGLTSRSGKGAGIGALSGGIGGLIWVLASRGKEVVLPSGTNFELELSSPLSFESEELEPPIRYPEGPAIPRREPGPGK